LQVEEPPEPGGGGTSSIPINTTVFTFTGSDAIPPCFVGTNEISRCQFINESGVDWTSITVLISPGIEDLSCGADFGFSECAPDPFSAGAPSIVRYFNGPGIADGEILHFAGFDWPENTSFTVVANNPIPEPASTVLIISGLGLVTLLRRARRFSRE
jgi:hypothetical protein